MGSGINNNAFLAGLLGGVGDHMMTQEERGYQEKQNELKLKRSILASLQADPNSSPQAQALALQGLLASPDQPKAKGIRGALGGKQAGAVSPLDDVINQIKGMPAQTQPAAPPIQIPPIPSAPAQAQPQGATGNQPWSEVPPIPVPGMAGSPPLVPPKLGMTGAPPQLPQETPGMPAVPGLHKSTEEQYQEAVMGAGAKVEGQYGAREKFGKKYVSEGLLKPENLPDFVASQTFGSAGRPTTTFSPVVMHNGKRAVEVIIDGRQTGQFMEAPEPGTAQHVWKVEAGPEGLPIGIRDPEGSLHQRNDSLVPPDVAAEYDARIKSHQTVRGEKLADATTQDVRATDRMFSGIDAREQVKQRTEIRKRADLATDADHRLAIMQDAVAHPSPQNDVALTFNHMGMTVAAQKGARMTDAEINRAIESRSLPQDMLARWTRVTSGQFLTPQERQDMLKLAVQVAQQSHNDVLNKSDEYGMDIKDVLPGYKAQAGQSRSVGRSEGVASMPTKGRFNKSKWAAAHPGEDADAAAKQAAEQGYEVSP